MCNLGITWILKLMQAQQIVKGFKLRCVNSGWIPITMDFIPRRSSCCPKSISYISEFVFRTWGIFTVDLLPLPPLVLQLKISLFKKKKKIVFPLFLWINTWHPAIANVGILCSSFFRSLEENKSSHYHQSFLYASQNIFTRYSIIYPSSRGWITTKVDMHKNCAIQ